MRDLTMGQRLCWFAAGELALANGNADAALHIGGQLLAFSANTSSEAVIPRLSILCGKALMTLHRWDEAEEMFLASRKEVLKEGEKPLLWRIDAALGRLYQLQGRGPQAFEAFLTAQRTITELRSNLMDTGLGEIFSKEAATFMPTVRPLSTRDALKKEAGGLTPREREVALMIARGRSNREMADELTVGERTIETHVSNILSKLGFSSRAQIAAWAVERGLSKEKEH